MKEVLQIINRKIGETNESISLLSKKLDIERTILNKFLNGQRLPIIDVVYKLLNYLFPEPHEAYQLLKRLLPSYKSLYSVKVMIEMARLNRDEETVAIAAGILKRTSSQKDREWADIYMLWHNYRKGEMDKKTYLDKLITFDPISEELKVFRNLCLCHNHTIINNEQVLALKYNEAAKELIDSLPDSMIKNSYLSRLYGYQAQILMRVSYKINPLIIELIQKAKHFSISELSTAIKDYNLFHHLEYLDYPRAQYHLQKSLDVEKIYAKEYDPSCIAFIDHVEKITIPFNKIFHNDLDAITEEDLSSPINQIYFQIKKGNIEAAKILLNNLDTQEKESDDYYLYLEGLIEQSVPLLMKFFKQMIERWYIYECVLVIDELVKLGVERFIIETMIDIKVNSIEHKLVNT